MKARVGISREHNPHAHATFAITPLVVSIPVISNHDKDQVIFRFTRRALWFYLAEAVFILLIIT